MVVVQDYCEDGVVPSSCFRLSFKDGLRGGNANELGNCLSSINGYHDWLLLVINATLGLRQMGLTSP